MNRNTYLFNIALLLLLTTSSLACFAQKDKQAKEILDKTSSLFAKSGGIKATFTIKNSTGSQHSTSKGDIQLKGNKFLFTTESGTTWFDGKTQWTYLNMSEEVNISNPSQEELQAINPYSLLTLYQKGHKYQYNGIKSINGKQVYEITLIPENSSQEFARVLISVSKTTYQPTRIVLEQTNKSKSEITISTYQTNQSYADGIFQFKKSNYPDAEVVDLR